MATTSADADVQERGLARFAQRLAGWTEKWFPDAYVFALAGVVVIALAALVNGSSPATVVSTFGDGFWDLTAFTLQMAMVVLTGYVVATAAPVARLIERIAVVPSSPRGAVAFVALLSCVVSLFNWGLSLVFSGLLARAIARRGDLRADYRALGAAAYLGLGAVWALGLSSSAAQLQATPDSLTPEVLDITGVLDFGATILTWQSMLMAVVLIALSVVVAWLSAPSGNAVRTAEDMGVDLDDTPQPESTGARRPGEWLEHSPVLPALVGLMTLGWLVVQLTDKPVLSVLSNLNGYLLVLLVLGLVLHGTPRRFLQAVTKAVPATAGVLVQFPLYAAMAAVLTRAEGRGGATLSAHLSDLFSGAGPGAFAVVIALYTAVLGLLVPSGGGKWLVEAPYVMQSATDVHMNLGWTVQIYNAAEALPNLVNPFFMLPLLAVLGVRARDLVGFTFLQFLFHLPVVLLLLWLLGTTFDFVPPVRP
jgi:short-chain fatty acids transporter